jgi:hypothetical protein
MAAERFYLGDERPQWKINNSNTVPIKFFKHGLLIQLYEILK